MAESTNDVQEVLTATGILSYAYFAQPFASKSDDGTDRLVYKTQVIMEPTSADIQKIKDSTRRVATAAWDSDAMQVLAKCAAQDKLALHDGNLQDGEEYKGKLFISCNAKKQPTIVVTMQGAALAAEVAKALQLNPSTPWALAVRSNGLTVANVPVGPEHALFPRSTDKCAVMFALYAQSPKRKPVKWGQRINCQLMGVQYLERGAGFGGGGRIARVDEFGINPVDADVAVPMAAQQADVGAAGGLF